MNEIRARASGGFTDLILKGVLMASLVIGTAALAAPVVDRSKLNAHRVGLVETVMGLQAQDRAGPARLVWQGADIDGDGQGDFVNPTGGDVRGHDSYGEGRFGASRDGGVRRHEGADFVAEAGQAVVAPISGYVTKIGYAYADDQNLRFVEIANPALRYAVRVFYINPAVVEGQVVRMGQPIGATHTLQRKYPGGMTDHVHLEVIDQRGGRINPTQVLTARWVGGNRG